MRALRYTIIFFLLFAMPAALLAELGNLPAATTWYIHADFKTMRSSDAGRHIYRWLQAEVFHEVQEEVGVDLDKEADTVTAWAAGDDGTVIVIDGAISQATEDKLVAMGAATGSLNRLGTDRRPYYFIKGDGHHGNGDIEVDAFDDGAYFTFAVKRKLIVASTEAAIQAMIEGKGRTEAPAGSEGALFVLRAERSLMQAGVRAGELGGEIGWDSNILRNTKQAALLVADEAGKIAIEAQLLTTEKAMADSLASIVRGLISLQIFNEDLDPDVASFLKSLSVDVVDTTLKLKVALEPELVVATLE